MGTSSEKLITVVVPLVPAHDHFVPNLIMQLSHEKEQISRVILARSSASDASALNLRELVEPLSHDCNIEISILPTRQQKLAGQNRNRGWHSVETVYTAFLDADDEYARNRLTTLVEVAESEGSDLVLHDFMLRGTAEGEIPVSTWSSDDLIRTSELYIATFPNGRSRHLEGLDPGDTNIVIPANPTNHRGVHHGHTFVRTQLRQKYRFSNLYPGEDGQFCRDILWDMNRVTYVPAPLSAYRPELSAERDADLTLKVRRRAAKFGRDLRARVMRS